MELQQLGVSIGSGSGLGIPSGHESGGPVDSDTS